MPNILLQARLVSQPPDHLNFPLLIRKEFHIPLYFQTEAKILGESPMVGAEERLQRQIPDERVLRKTLGSVARRLESRVGVGTAASHTSKTMERGS